MHWGISVCIFIYMIFCEHVSAYPASHSKFYKKLHTKAKLVHPVSPYLFEDAIDVLSNTVSSFKWQVEVELLNPIFISFV